MTAPQDDRNCTECLKWLRDEKGKVKTRPAKGGRPIPLPITAPLPCINCAKIPKDSTPHPAFALNPTDRSRRAFQHYRECRAVNWNVPDAADPLVRHHAAVIRQVEDQIAAARESQAWATAAIISSARSEKWPTKK